MTGSKGEVPEGKPRQSEAVWGNRQENPSRDCTNCTKSPECAQFRGRDQWPSAFLVGADRHRFCSDAVDWSGVDAIEQM